MTAPERPSARKSHRLVAVTLDENSIGRSGPDIEHERAVAIYDLLESNSFAPEGSARGPFKLNLSITGNRLMFDIRNAGAIFLGAHTPEAIGDYVGGSNHVLPTARSARFASGLGVLDFMKRTSILKCGPEQLRALAPAAIALGEAEGLDAHARSVAIRLNR